MGLWQVWEGSAADKRWMAEAGSASVQQTDFESALVWSGGGGTPPAGGLRALLPAACACTKPAGRSQLAPLTPLHPAAPALTTLDCRARGARARSRNAHPATAEDAVLASPRTRQAASKRERLQALMPRLRMRRGSAVGSCARAREGSTGTRVGRHARCKGRCKGAESTRKAGCAREKPRPAMSPRAQSRRPRRPGTAGGLTW
jgi:hypothetical protein